MQTKPTKTLLIRRSEERGHFDHGWLNTYHTFSFAGYYDLDWMGFRALRVLNEDRVQPGEGFERHPHHEMEIISYGISGRLAHVDSTGARGTICRGDIQVMSAGTGLTHSEFNASNHEPVHFIQIWVLPNRREVAPRYDQRQYLLENRTDKLVPLVGPLGAAEQQGALGIYADCWLYGTLLTAGNSVTHKLKPDRAAWLHVIKGEIGVLGETLKTGDAIGIAQIDDLTITAAADSELLLFDLD
ncbi:pirin family protein [bacterium]|nr:pirin family protein [bacterium]